MRNLDLVNTVIKSSGEINPDKRLLKILLTQHLR